MCDQLDSFTICNGELPVLPDAEFLREFCQKLKSKLRTFDDTSFSTKLFRKDAEVENVLKEVRDNLSGLSRIEKSLESYQIRQKILLNHIYEIRLHILKPLLELIDEYHSLPNMTGNWDLTRHLQAMETTENSYNEIRSLSIFIELAKLKHQAEYIENILLEMITPLQRAAKYQKIVLLRRDSASWIRVLLPLLQSSEEDFFTRMLNK